MNTLGHAPTGRGNGRRFFLVARGRCVYLFVLFLFVSFIFVVMAPMAGAHA